MIEKVFHELRMTLRSEGKSFFLDLSIASRHAEYEVTISLEEKDFSVIENDEERAAFLQAALHHPFQLKATWPTEEEQRHYLDTILHSPKEEVEAFLTEKDHGRANGAISNAVRITTGKNSAPMRAGTWFKTS